MGAHPRGDGFSGAHVHMSNTLNTPVEALELAYPLRLTRYHLRRGSGGAGRHRGGDGIVREYEILRPTTATILSERRAIAPWGLAGGEPASPGRNLFIVDIDGSEEELSSKATRRMSPGQRLRIETSRRRWLGQPPALREKQLYRCSLHATNTLARLITATAPKTH